jgi:hypothetical protein
MPAQRHVLAVLLAVSIALEALAPPFGDAATAASIVLALATGFFAPAVARGAAMRAAALGSVVDAAARAFLLWQVGGVGSVSVGAVVPPALVALSAVLLAVMTARWWRGIWRLGSEPRAFATRLRPS